MKGKLRGKESHFLALRRRLDLLGYNNFLLGIDSAPLAQQMLEDLVSTTETLRDLEGQYKEFQDKYDEALAMVEPLQIENTRLQRDNIQLHQRLVKIKEQYIKMENQNSSTSFELQAENRRLILLNQQSSDVIQDLQKRIDTLKDKLAQSIATPPILKTSEMIDGDIRRSKRSPSMTFNSGIPEEASEHEEMLQVEISHLRKENEESAAKIKEHEADFQKFTAIIKEKDEEIQRLGHELERATGQNGYLLKLENSVKRQSEEIETLRAQVRCSSPYSPKKPAPVTKPKSPIKQAQRLRISKCEGVSFKPSSTSKDEYIAELERKLQAPSVEVLIDDTEIERLEEELVRLNTEYEEKIAQKDEQILQLQKLISTRQGGQVKAISSPKKDLTQDIAEIDKLRALVTKQHNQIKDQEKALEEAKKFAKPELSKQYINTVELLQKEHVALVKENAEAHQEIERLTHQLEQANSVGKELRARIHAID